MGDSAMSGFEKEEKFLIEENESLREEIRKEALTSNHILTCSNPSCHFTYQNFEDHISVEESWPQRMISCIISHPSKLSILSKSRLDVCDDQLRIIGEIAFQLDRRIIQYVFFPRRRLYGFTARNITIKIEEYGRDDEISKESIRVQKHLWKKYENLMGLLQDSTGYDRVYHSKFSELLVNTFGVVHTNSKRSKLEYIEIKSTILKCMGANFLKDTMILLESLVILATYDGRVLFL